MYLDAFRLVQGSVELRNSHVSSCIEFIRANPYLREATIVYIPENLPSNTGGMVAHYCRDIHNSVTMREFGADRRNGVPKDQKITMTMMLRMKRALMNQCLQFADPLGIYERGSTLKEAAVVQVLCDQMLSYRFDEKTKKLSGKGDGGRDDLLVSAMMILYWQEAFQEDPQYASVRTAQNGRVLLAPTPAELAAAPSWVFPAPAPQTPPESEKRAEK